MQSNESLKDEVLSSSTADDVALIALKRGYEFSGDELLRFSGKNLTPDLGPTLLVLLAPPLPTGPFHLLKKIAVFLIYSGRSNSL